MKNSLLQLFLLLSITSPLFATDAMRGQQLYQAQCAACHSFAHNEVGPSHAGIYGRAVGTVSDYMYSSALKSARLVWSEKNLDQWLKNPEVFLPGQKMGYSVTNEVDRKDIIEYLKQQSKK